MLEQGDGLNASQIGAKLLLGREKCLQYSTDWHRRGTAKGMLKLQIVSCQMLITVLQKVVCSW